MTFFRNILKLRANRAKRPARQPGRFHDGRGKLISILALGCFVALIARGVKLSLFPAKQQSLNHIASAQYQKKITLAPYRGSIYDRRGEPLAISIRKPSLVVNPSKFKPTKSQTKLLARYLGIPQSRITRIAKKDNQFAWLKRQTTLARAQKALSIEIDGLSLVQEPGRYYPAGNAAAHLLGFVGIDNDGLIGLERQFDKDLRGQPITITPTKDAKRRTIFKEAIGAAPEKTGHSLHLTLDRVVQEIAEEALAKWSLKTRANKAYAIVADPHTGRILAMANYPPFDLNDTRSLKMKKAKNHALLDVFEPGSTTKPLVVAAAIETKKTWPQEMHDCENGKMRLNRRTIHDTHPAKMLSTEQTVVQSSNICAYKIAKKMGPELFSKMMHKFGLGSQEVALDIPGEGRGWMQNWQTWKDIRFANISFGQGFMTSALELVQAMSAIANGGILMKPMLVEKITTSDGIVVSSTPTEQIRRVISPETAKKVRYILHLVTEDEEGTGKSARTEHYSTAGKTGTAQKVDPGIKGYAKGKYLVSFLGFAPVKDPHLTIYVGVDEPKEKPFYGSAWAAPIFAEIAEKSLHYLNVAPDKFPKVAEGQTTNDKQNL